MGGGEVACKRQVPPGQKRVHAAVACVRVRAWRASGRRASLLEARDAPARDHVERRKARAPHVHGELDLIVCAIRLTLVLLRLPLDDRVDLCIDRVLLPLVCQHQRGNKAARCAAWQREAMRALNQVEILAALHSKQRT
eukprot:7162148-Prymnesium_polylepis.2